MPKASLKGYHLVGRYTTLEAAERKAKKSSHLKTKITENKGKIRITPSGKRRLHPSDYPGGKETKVYRVWVK